MDDLRGGKKGLMMPYQKDSFALNGILIPFNFALNGITISLNYIIKVTNIHLVHKISFVCSYCRRNILLLFSLLEKYHFAEEGIN